VDLLGTCAHISASVSGAAYLRTLANVALWQRIKSSKEIVGQLPRLFFFGGVKSFVGKIPVGNTGGANVPPLLTMPIPEDLQRVLEKCR
jgi:hypothetical protein